jgi:nitroimidazol reductase NimA-like FMN-containing flavoprotein (pyridoxamine 5'-phosphate oxidase superfamily)
MSSEILEEMTAIKMTRKMVQDMTRAEIDQFLACSTVGRVGITLERGCYIVPVGYAYQNGEIFFHSCFSGLKMDGLRANPNVCFEVDESTSDVSMYKSVIAWGKSRIIDDPEEMRPYLQALIDKYRMPVSFEEYMSRPGRDLDKEMAIVRIVVIKPAEIRGIMMIRINQKNSESIK